MFSPILWTRWRIILWWARDTLVCIACQDFNFLKLSDLDFRKGFPIGVFLWIWGLQNTPKTELEFLVENYAFGFDDL